NDLRSHLRDLNPRPTVYESFSLMSDFANLGLCRARARAHEALVEIAAGGHALAGAVLVELLIAGHEGAQEALPEIAGGRWARAIDLLGKIANGATSRRAFPRTTTR